MVGDRGPMDVGDGGAAEAAESGAGGSQGALLVLITHPVAGATSFARSLVDRQLAACVNVLPVTSVYRWKGAVEEDAEQLLIVKTSSRCLAALESHLEECHPYDVPECVAVEPRHVEPRYLEWLLGATGATGALGGDGAPDGEAGKEKKA